MAATPRDLFERMREHFLDTGPLVGAFMTEDVVIESPFAPPGRPDRFEGRETFLRYANPQRAAFPVTMEECRTRAIHDTADPDTIVVEYELTGRALHPDRRATLPFIAVLTARDGKIAGWREYQNTAALQQALATLTG